MEFRHLRYFVAVAEEENVTRAAARLHVSQSVAGSRLRIRALNPAPAPVVVGVAYRKGRITAVAEKFLASLRRARSA